MSMRVSPLICARICVTIASVLLFLVTCISKINFVMLYCLSYLARRSGSQAIIDWISIYNTVCEKQICTSLHYSLQDEYYLNTRRVIDFDRLVRTIVTGFSSKDSRETSNSTSAATSAFAGTGRDDEAAAAIESLKQIAIALTSGVSTEGAHCVALAKTLGDLMALIPRQGKEVLKNVME